MLLLFEDDRDARIDLFKSQRQKEGTKKVALQDVKVVQKQDSKPKEQKKLSKIVPLVRAVKPEPEPISPQKETEKVYHVKCDRCKKEFDLTSKNLTLRTLFGIPVDSYNCIVCKQRNYIFTQEYTEKLVKQYSEYRIEHP